MKGGESYPGSPSVMRISPAFSSAGAVVLSLFLLAPAALAADGERTPLNLSDQDSAPAQAAGSAGGGLVRTIVGLAIVVGVIYGLYWILKQVKASREETASALNAALHVAAGVPIVMHDFSGRPHYHAVLEHLHVVALAGSLAVLQRRADFDPARVVDGIARHALDLR